MADASATTNDDGVTWALATDMVATVALIPSNKPVATRVSSVD